MENDLRSIDGAAIAPDSVVEIRRCVVTQSRIVIFFEGELDPGAAADQDRYAVLPAPRFVGAKGRRGAQVDLRPVLGVTYDEASQATVTANPYPDEEAGRWLWIRFNAALEGEWRGPDYWARVESDNDALARELNGDSILKLDRSHGDSDVPRTRRASLTGPVELTPGLLAVVFGVVALVTLGLSAMFLSAEGEMVPIATGAFGVIGSVVGAFFGVHAGLGSRENSEQARQAEAVKGQLLALMVSEGNQPTARKMVEGRSSGRPR